MTSAIKILIDPPKNVRPENSIRADVAWKLYLPDYMGDIPPFVKAKVTAFRHWLWWELSTRLGYLRPDKPDAVYILTPTLTEASREFIIRTASFWADEVYAVAPGDGAYDIENAGENLWTPPVVNLNRSYGSSSAVGVMHEEMESGDHNFYSHVLGATRSFIRTYVIKNGSTYSRFHSHTAREEFYLVLKGKGSARIGGHKVEIGEGDLISKPLGPDLSSQFLADLGEDLRIMDVEIWPDDERKSKDLVSYPDHGELDLFGEGWNFMIPSDAINPFQDAMDNYGTGYRRKLDGTWEPKEVPGLEKRKQ